MHKQFLTLTTLCLLAAGTIPAATAAGNGAALHQENCTSCHDDSVYTRKDRRVTTLDGLKKQVQRCELSQGLKWFDEDIDDVVAYLNSTYYKFR
jgi:mono/diheme cytochrome c family protein